MEVSELQLSLVGLDWVGAGVRAALRPVLIHVLKYLNLGKSCIRKILRIEKRVQHFRG